MTGQVTIVGIGASAGGLDATSRLLEALPSGGGMAFILVQHLDPGHESMMVELLARNTAMTVCQATEGMRIEPEHLYVIPPGTYLSVSNDALHLSAPPARRGARLPFDYLLRSMADCYGERAACVILSGTGSDGSAGLLAIKTEGGFVVAQDPAEAGYEGMPRSAIRTGGVNFVLPVADIPAALIAHRAPASGVPGRGQDPRSGRHAERADAVNDQLLTTIIELLRTQTIHDFSLYKSGTVQRRVERRMAMAAVRPDDMAAYLDVLRGDSGEIDLLAKDLLINVTGFFRDAIVFDRLAETIIPDLVKGHDPDRPLRVWVAGCSTGEEAYSLAMLFMEQISAAKRPIKLQMFATDIDVDAVAAARDGLYANTIEDCVTPERLKRFFTPEEAGWRAAPDLRSAIVFTVHDVLTDPPFSRLDLVSCRNLLIYLQSAAQAKVMEVFHFALREDGFLLLGNAETVVAAEGRFEVAAKHERIYRRIGRSQLIKSGHSPGSGLDRSEDSVRHQAVPKSGRLSSRPAAVAEIGRRMVIETYAPASVLINAANETVFSLGPTDRYLRLSPGHATLELLAMARPGLRAKLRSAVQTARETRAKVRVSGRISGDAQGSFNIEVHPILEADQEMLLVCFVDAPRSELKADRPLPARQLPRIAELERDLEATRTELQETIRALELSSEEQKATNEEALSVNEEYQSTNEELLTSKEELQSLNEELTALNSQLQETLEQQRTSADDLQNVLYSTNVATLFLDRELRIRFFTPATKALFAVIANDVGRPLADLAALTHDTSLNADAQTVLDAPEPLEREIEARNGVWFRRRILPYRAHGDRVEGVVITFTDITGRKNVADALEAAKKQAEIANVAKSRFLAAASHDLRQPLQTLALLQALLAKIVDGARAEGLVARMDDTLGAMTAMLNALLDINKIEAGAVQPELSSFKISSLFDRLRDEFTYHAQAKGLTLRVSPCNAHVTSDPRLLEQMIRNLLSNALKYTAEGRILLGCRRRGPDISVEVWDTGIGIPQAELDTIFEEYHQIGNAARERSRGLGLGLSIVKRLGELLDHRVRVRSRPGKGSGFTIEVPLSDGSSAIDTIPAPAAADEPRTSSGAMILVVEDDPDLRELLGQLLTGEGHQVTSAPDGPAALDCLARCTPDLLLADYNLPNGPNGLELVGSIRQALGQDVPVIILTGDVSIEKSSAVAGDSCAQLNKPVKPAELMSAIDHLLSAISPVVQPIIPTLVPLGRSTVFVVDDDDNVRDAIIAILEDDGRAAVGYPSSEAFLQAYHPGGAACLLIDAYLPGMDGIGLVERLRASGDRLPAIMITGQSDVPMAVRAMKVGASDFIEKPVSRSSLLASIRRALEQSRDATKLSGWRQEAADHVAALTSRQRQIMALVLAGHPSKNIAADLGISQRTVENHRAAIMHKTGAASLPALARLAIAAAPEKVSAMTDLPKVTGLPM
ncbi:chemotaxis protein CheB [Rhodopila sp.]|uniref:chemotaxis protein CheB n=1 Tax=Rhodopila sp. TaxID=2480087 RepID=UPI003D118CFD